MPVLATTGEMTMDFSSDEGPQMHFRLGRAERWMISIGGTLLLSVLGWLSTTTLAKLTEQGDTMHAVQTQQAAAMQKLTDMTEELSNLRSQLADIPSIARDIATIKVQIHEHERRLENVEGGPQPELKRRQR